MKHACALATGEEEHESPHRDRRSARVPACADLSCVEQEAESLRTYHLSSSLLFHHFKRRVCAFMMLWVVAAISLYERLRMYVFHASDRAVRTLGQRM